MTELTFKFKGKEYKLMTCGDFKRILKPVYVKGTWKTLWKSSKRDPTTEEINERAMNMMFKYYPEIAIKDITKFIKKLLGDFTK